MGKKQTCPAIKMKKRKAKKLESLKHCTIPKAVTRKHTGVFDHHGDELDFTLDALKPYRELRAARKEQLKKYSNGKPVNIHTKRLKTPWYMLTRGKIYHYEERQESFGAHTGWFKTESEYSTLYNKTVPKKMTRNDFVERLLKSKMDDWKQTHPEPKQDDLFYAEEHPKWEMDYEAYHDRIMGSLSDKIHKFDKHLVTTILNSKNRQPLMAAALPTNNSGYP